MVREVDDPGGVAGADVNHRCRGARLTDRGRAGRDDVVNRDEVTRCAAATSLSQRSTEEMAARWKQPALPGMAAASVGWAAAWLRSPGPYRRSAGEVHDSPGQGEVSPCWPVLV
jgi:hypothetical protein